MKKAVREVHNKNNPWIKEFDEDEAIRAEQIVDALEGLTIYSAQTLLTKVNNYLLEELVTVVV